MDAQGIWQVVAQKCGDAVSPLVVEGTKDPYFKVKPEKWPEVAAALRRTPELDFDFLNVITAVDWIKQNQIQVVYHLYSYRHKHLIVVKIDLDRAQPRVPSVTSIWRAANWNEREQFDLLGVEFVGHPDLRRILMPDDWVGYPMRKDFKEPAEYRGMSTTRPAVLDLLGTYDKGNVAAASASPKPKSDGT